VKDEWMNIESKLSRFLWIRFPVLGLVFLFFSCTVITPNSSDLQVEMLEAAYNQYKEASISQRRFKHADIVPLINNRQENFKVEILGKSVEGREIYQLAYGSGPTRVLLWSQMHGNESTATMALFDLFNFLEGKIDPYDSVRNLLKEKLTIRFVPMVNPDGAEVFQRRNAWDIDLNRDAIEETTPEAKILKAAREHFEPHFGFNLHDQQIYYNASGTAKPATISVLAPAYNPETQVNEVRAKSMKLIAGMNTLLQELIPGQVAKYDDAFEPRAFGDNFQKWGTSTILIESGGYPGDIEKQYIRQLNFMVILNAFYGIAVGNYEKYSLDEYYRIPDNDSKLMDLLIKKVGIHEYDRKYQVDLGIKRREAETDSGYYVKGTIEDIGDLSVFYGYEEIQAEGLQFKEGNIWEGTFRSLADLSEKKAMELLRQGYSAVKVADVEINTLHNLPIAVIKEEKNHTSGREIGHPANFFLHKEGKLLYAVVNGYLIDLHNPSSYKFKQAVY
jgi:hypothetical protein